MVYYICAACTNTQWRKKGVRSICGAYGRTARGGAKTRMGENILALLTHDYSQNVLQIRAWPLINLPDAIISDVTVVGDLLKAFQAYKPQLSK